LNRLDRKESQVSIAKHYGVHPSLVSWVFKQKYQVMQDWQNNSNPERKRKRTAKAQYVDEALLC